MMQVEGIGVERDIAGTPKVKLPANADTSSGSDDMNRAEQVVRNLRNDEQAGIVEPNDWEVSLLSSSGGRLFDTDKIITRYDQRILALIRGQSLVQKRLQLLGQGTVVGEVERCGSFTAPRHRGRSWRHFPTRPNQH